MNMSLSQDCPEEQALLDYLAGELGPQTAREVERHLAICTDCALRADGLSEDFADVERAIEVELPLPPLRLAAARARLRERQEAYEVSRSARADRGADRPIWARLALAAAAVVLLVGTGGLIYLLPDGPALTAEQVLARAQESIPTYGIQPAMARYQVEITQIEPEPIVREHQLVIWTDPSGGGYASRLEDPDGAVRHAVWRRASNGPAFAYDQDAGTTLIRIDRSGRADPPTLLASMWSGIDCDALAAGFARWLEARRWYPLRVSRDFALLASDDATVRLERSGDSLLVVTRKQQGDLQAEVTLALSAETYEPDWLLFHFRSPQGESTFKLVQNEVRFIASSRLDTSVFEARVPSSGAIRALSAPAPQPRAERGSAGPDLRTVEARLWYALHEAGACLGEPVEVARGSDGALAVRGIVGSSDVKAAILKALESTGAPDSVSVDIRTREEALRAVVERVGFERASTRPDLEAARPRVRSGSVRMIPLTADLTAYFRAGDPPNSGDSVGRDLSGFADGAVERADDLLQRGWALRRLAEHYAPSAVETSSTSSHETAALLREMYQDHLDGIAESARKSADWTLPALTAIADSRGIEIGAAGIPSRSPAAMGSWPELILSLFEAASSIHRDTLALLTVRLDVADDQAGSAGQDRSQDVEDVDRTLRRLLATSRGFGTKAAQTADAFAAGPDPAPAARLRREAQQ